MRLSASVSVCLAGLAWSMAATAMTLVSETGVIPCGPKIQFVCDAAAVTDEEDRHARLLQAIAKGLESDDATVRDETFSYLAEIEPFPLDPRPLHRALERFDELGGTHRGAWMVEGAELRLAPRETRIHYYQIAIVTGRADIGKFAWISRSVAMTSAAAEGLAELRDPIVEYYSALDPREQRRVRLNCLMAELDLRGGAQSLQDAAAVALRRLTSMPSGDLGAKIDGDVGWREALTNIKLQLCKIPPYTGCGQFKSLMQQQGKLFGDRHQARANTLDSTPGRVVPVQPPPEQRQVLEWLRSVQ